MSRKLLLKRISLAVFLIASSNLAWEIYREVMDTIEMERIARETGWIMCTFGPSRDMLARFHIEMFLILVLIGNRLSRLPRTLLNVLGLTGVVISYIFWWQYYFRIMELSGARSDVIKNFVYLAGGTIFDVGIAVSIGLLVLLNVRDAALSFVSVDDQ